MEQQNLNYYCPQDELDDEISIDLKKILLTLWNRKVRIVFIVICTIALFVALTFIMPKKYVVNADLYINKSNNSNMTEVNPYVISDLGAGGGMAALMSSGGTLSNDIELMQSALVIDKVIMDNNLCYKKLFGIIPTVKTGTFLSTEAFLKKGISFENKKGTNVVTIGYKSKDRELAYNVVNSIILHYIDLNREINSGKSKSDRALLQSEYDKAKADLNKKMNEINGLPAAATNSAGGLAALSSISKSARKAMSSIQGQYVSGVKSELLLREEAAKVAELSRKLEWAKLVDNMSDSSKVIVLKEPRLLEEYEQASPKLFTNILLGIVFGVIAALVSVIWAENFDKKLTYSMLGESIIYNLRKDFVDLKRILLTNQNKNITIVLFEQLPAILIDKLKENKNLRIVNADISNDFINGISSSSDVIMFATVNKTNAELYKQVKQMINEMNKNILKEVLV